MTPKLPNLEPITRFQLWTALPHSPSYWLRGEYDSIGECMRDKSAFLKNCPAALCVVVLETKIKITVPFH